MRCLDALWSGLLTVWCPSHDGVCHGLRAAHNLYLHTKYKQPQKSWVQSSGYALRSDTHACHDMLQVQLCFNKL
jgi:hypothetical protein